MEPLSKDQEIEILKQEIETLNLKLKKAQGFLHFLATDTDPTHSLRSALVNVKSFMAVVEMMDYQVEINDMKEMINDLKNSVTKLMDIIDGICKTL